MVVARLWRCLLHLDDQLVQDDETTVQEKLTSAKLELVALKQELATLERKQETAERKCQDAITAADKALLKNECNRLLSLQYHASEQVGAQASLVASLTRRLTNLNRSFFLRYGAGFLSKCTR